MTLKESLLQIMKEIHKQAQTEEVVLVILCKDCKPFSNPVLGYKVANSQNSGMAFILSVDSEGINKVINSALVAATRLRNGTRCED